MLKVSNLCYKHGKKAVIEEVCFELPPGRLLCLLGDNGAGKSTLIRLLSGLLKPYSGFIQYMGKIFSALTQPELARLRSVLYQHNPQDIPFTPELLMEISRYSWKGVQEGSRVYQEKEQLLNLFQVSHLRGRNMGTLSGGEQQRIHFARTLLQRNLEAGSIILLDEPFNHLDLKHRHSAMKTMRSLCEMNHTVIMVMHDLQFALQYADDVLLLKSGKMLGYGYARQVMTPEILTEAFGIPFQITTVPGCDYPILFSMAELSERDHANQLISTKPLNVQNEYTNVFPSASLA